MNLEKLRLYKDCKGKIKEIISEQEMAELVKCLYVPHYVLLNPLTKAEVYYFAAAELNDWFVEKYVTKIESKYSPKLNFISVIDAHSSPKCPPQLSAIQNLFALPIDYYFSSSGVYFLCLNNEIVYIGQSVNVSSRIAQHFEAKEFDSVFYIPVPPCDLDRFETALIKYYQPILNKRLVPLSAHRAKYLGIDIDGVLDYLSIS